LSGCGPVCPLHGRAGPDLIWCHFVLVQGGPWGTVQSRVADAGSPR
jgi:hypothetical protein